MECYHPVVIRLPDGQYQQVRCGKCLSCLSHRQAEWTTRLGIELKAHPDQCYFVTLTYAEENLPLKIVWRSPDENSPAIDGRVQIPVVSKVDVQKFHMDLRKRFQQGFFFDDTLVRSGLRKRPERLLLDPQTRFRYYVTSEYGPEGHRPHYHGFYSALPEDEYLVQCLFEQTWKNGFVKCERASSDACAAYVAKYLVNDSLVPLPPGATRPFALMSKGLGSEYLENPRLMDWHRQAPVKRCYIPDQSDKKVMSRYLREKIFDDSMKEEIYLDSVTRSERQQAHFDALPLDEQIAFRKERVRQEEEARRQAEWRFRRDAKLK